jgi:hypothetical protein
VSIIDSAQDGLQARRDVDSLRHDALGCEQCAELVALSPEPESEVEHDIVPCRDMSQQARLQVCCHLDDHFGGGRAGLAFLTDKKHSDQDADPSVKLGVFATGPEVRSYGWNFLTEVIATFVLVFWVLVSGNTPAEIGPLGVALVVLVIGASLGGPTGYAINPARDFSPRLVHALLPIRGKGSSDWRYAWVPVAGPVVGGLLAGVLANTIGWVY